MFVFYKMWNSFRLSIKLIRHLLSLLKWYDFLFWCNTCDSKKKHKRNICHQPAIRHWDEEVEGGVRAWIPLFLSQSSPNGKRRLLSRSGTHEIDCRDFKSVPLKRRIIEIARKCGIEGPCLCDKHERLWQVWMNAGPVSVTLDRY